MTPEAQNAIIGEHAGWKFKPIFVRATELESAHERGEASGCWIRPGNEDWQHERLPDFVNDLNAMRDVLIELSDEQFMEYTATLVNVVTANSSTVLENLRTSEKRRLFSAHASQQSQALVRTIGKWKEGA